MALDNPYTIEARYPDKDPPEGYCSTCESEGRSFLPGVAMCTVCASDVMVGVIEAYVPDLNGIEHEIVDHVVQMLLSERDYLGSHATNLEFNRRAKAAQRKLLDRWSKL